MTRCPQPLSSGARHTDVRDKGGGMDHLLSLQSGVVARRQLLEAGLAPHDVRRLVRRRDLVPLHPGVYVNHTGEPTWLQQAWAAVLWHAPAALSHVGAAGQ